MVPLAGAFLVAACGDDNPAPIPVDTPDAGGGTGGADSSAGGSGDATGGASMGDGGGGSGGMASGAGGGGAGGMGMGGMAMDSGADAADAEPPLEPGATVTIDDGDIQGYLDGTTHRFLGIPYAKPPIDDLRWRAPVPNDPWTGTLDAREFGGRCAQLSSIQADESLNEDCLYLNVWTPDPETDPAPVMVWFHGGGNQTGSAGDPIPLNVGGLYYNGHSFAERHGIVVVTANYRLNALGFFAHPNLADEDDPVGNQGLQDQKLVLEWVQDNIEAFGGDPNNVTIFGESAGSFDVCFHVATSATNPLFHRAISQSGGCTSSKMETQAEAQGSVQAFTQAMGCDTDDDPLACLRAKPVEDLIQEAPQDGADTSDGGVIVHPGGDQYQGTTARWALRPIVDGDVIPGQPRTLFNAGTIAQVDYILGSNTDEGRLFHLGATPVESETEFREALMRRFNDSALVDGIVDLYPASDFDDSWDDALQRLTGDIGLVCGTHDTARRAATAGLKVYMYNFDFPIAVEGFEFLGAVHGAEIVYAFNGLSNPTGDQKAVSDAMHDYWARFAETGDPNGDDALAWPEFTVANDQRIQIAPTLEVLDDFRATECEFWRAYMDAQFE
jgi:para-nitrobenzyl esterase